MYILPGSPQFCQRRFLRSIARYLLRRIHIAGSTVLLHRLDDMIYLLSFVEYSVSVVVIVIYVCAGFTLVDELINDFIHEIFQNQICCIVFGFLAVVRLWFWRQFEAKSFDEARRCVQVNDCWQISLPCLLTAILGFVLRSRCLLYDEYLEIGLL